MPYLTAPTGTEWFYEEEGEGAPLFFLHGWGVNRKIWRQQTKFFAAQYRVIAVDLPGHGQSGWRPTTLTRMIQDAWFVWDSLECEKGGLVASSLGGLVAMGMAATRPEAVVGLSLVGSHPCFSGREAYPSGLDVERIETLAGQLEAHYPQMVHIFFRSLFTRQERSSRRFRWIQTFRKGDEIPDKEALLNLVSIIKDSDLTEIFASLVVPIQMICGTHDYIVPRETILYWQERRPDLRVVWFENCGHFPFLTQPHEFNAALAQFWQEIGYGPVEKKG